MPGFGNMVRSLLLLCVILLALGCGDNGNVPSGFSCQDITFSFPHCPEIRSCCSETFCYYDVAGLTFDCRGTDCTWAYDRVSDYCIETQQDAIIYDVALNDSSQTVKYGKASKVTCDPDRWTMTNTENRIVASAQWHFVRYC